MSGRYDRFVDSVRSMLIETPGALSSETRRAIVNREARTIPPALTPYLAKVAQHAYRIEDEDIAALRRAGLSEDEIFEATASAAVGAALLRLDAGMAALRAPAKNR